MNEEFINIPEDKNDDKDEIKPKIIVNLSFLLLFIIAILISVFTGIYTLDVEHAAVVTTFGSPQSVTEPGLHFAIPFIQKVQKVDTTVKGIAIGYDIGTGENIDAESVMISSDYNFLNIDFYLECQVTDPVQFIYASNNPYEILRATSQNCIRTVIASYGVDSILTTGKNEIQANIKAMLVEKIDNLDIGITVRNITIQDSEPPTDAVNEAFKAVETAKQGKETAVNKANQYRNENLPAAEAEVDKILQDAEAKKSQRIAEAEGQVARFNSMYEEYKKYPLITKERMFYETMEDVLPGMKVIIQGKDGNVNSILPLEKFSDNSVVNGGVANEEE